MGFVAQRKGGAIGGGPALLSIQELVRALGTTTLLATGSGRKQLEQVGDHRAEILTGSELRADR